MPFGHVRYSIIGDDVAVNLFNIDEVNGNINVVGDLSTSGAESYTIRVQARDLGDPARYGYKVCSVSVQQKFQPPFFLNNSHQATVQESFPLGNTILTVYGRDNDLAAPHNTVRYRLMRDPEDLECFLINKVTGNLALCRSLLYDPCTANVFFGNDNSPFFLNDPYARTLVETEAVGTLVYDTLAPFNTLTYSIIGDDAAASYFRINSTTGNVFLASSV
ncbi:protocadherin Fat 3-like [Mya arenaria]|uniref:protocadherin Fat 3-like n=1 Tax=Mya arenaria TaxID=6604 RepID=UPI0022E6D6DC|nr:protocadherin Fat 3-like [Mya arenaria]